MARKNFHKNCPFSETGFVFNNETPRRTMKPFNKRYLKWGILLMTTLTIFVSGAKAQKKPQSIEKRKKELAEIKERQEREKQQALEEMRKQHLAIQDKKTRKRMKKNKKKAARNTTNKRKFSLKRIFGKK